MLVGLQKGRYVIDTIEQEGADICIYTAHNKKKQRFVVNEIRSIALINLWLPKLSAFAQNGGLECFTENSFLYIVTHYYDGENAASYFSITKPESGVKLDMLKQFIFRLIELSEYPDVIMCSMLMPQAVCVYRGEICQNCYIVPPEKSPFTLLYELLESFFTPEEIKKNSFLSIVLQKLKNGMYENFTQVYLDWQQLAEKRRGGNPAVEAISGWWRRYGSLVKILASAAVIILAVVVIYNSFIKGAIASDSKTYNPIDHIGTVSISESGENTDNEGSFREIHAAK
ncbi:MAG: hypothetical protein ACI4RK_07155 [Oscillospiraceae bacterium]